MSGGNGLVVLFTFILCRLTVNVRYNCQKEPSSHSFDERWFHLVELISLSVLGVYEVCAFSCLLDCMIDRLIGSLHGSDCCDYVGSLI